MPGPDQQWHPNAMPTTTDQQWQEKGAVVRDDVRTEGDILGMGGSRISRVTFENGETWDIPEDPNKPPQLVNFESSLATAWRAKNKTTAPTTRQGADGQDYQWNGETGQWEPAPGMPTQQAEQDTWSAGSTSSPYLVRQGANGSLEQIPNPNYRAPTGPQLAPRYADEAEYQQLQNEMLRQKMMSQHETDVREIGNMIARGEIDQAGADRMLALSRANFEASLRGTTPFQEQTQKLNVAGDIMGRRMSTGSSMAQGLLSGASGIYGNILGGQNPPTNFNPLSMAQGFTDQMGGGPEMAELAKAILSGALQGGGL